MESAHRFGDVEARQYIPSGDEGEQDCSGNLQIGGHIHTHDAHMREVVQSQEQKQHKPEKLACTDTQNRSSTGVLNACAVVMRT